MSNDHVSQTIRFYEKQVADLEEQLKFKKRLVNQLCKDIGVEPPFPDIENSEASGGRSLAIAPDEFFTKPLATAVTAILEKRKTAGLGPATLDELYSAMLQGGFTFDAKTSGNAKRALATAVAKNSYTFVKLPNGSYGLKSWYPDLPKIRATKRDQTREVEEEKAETEVDPAEEQEVAEFRASWDSNGVEEEATLPTDK